MGCTASARAQTTVVENNQAPIKETSQHNGGEVEATHGDGKGKDRLEGEQNGNILHTEEKPDCRGQESAETEQKAEQAEGNQDDSGTTTDTNGAIVHQAEPTEETRQTPVEQTTQLDKTETANKEDENEDMSSEQQHDTSAQHDINVNSEKVDDTVTDVCSSGGADTAEPEAAGTEAIEKAKEDTTSKIEQDGIPQGGEVGEEKPPGDEAGEENPSGEDTKCDKESAEASAAANTPTDEDSTDSKPKPEATEDAGDKPAVESDPVNDK